MVRQPFDEISRCGRSYANRRISSIDAADVRVQDYDDAAGRHRFDGLRD